MSPRTFVIVGAGLAGAKAAESLRAEGFDGRIQLVGDEPERPYLRPPLSKEYLSGTKERDSLFVHKESWYQDQQVELRTGIAVVGLDLATQEFELADGERLVFDRALLATGATPRRIELPGSGLAGIHYLRRMSDSDALRSVLAGGDRVVVVIGGGWIGLEVSAAARNFGNQVTVIEPQKLPLLGVLGPELGEIYAGLHREHGVDLVLGENAAALHGAGGQVTSVTTESGREFAADLVLVGIGALPNTGIAEISGLAIDNGILVDQALRSSHPAVFAAGDVANALHPRLGRHIRVEHWANALYGGRAAGRSMLDLPVSYDRTPYFYSDQYDFGMEYVGEIGPQGYDEVVFRGDRAGREFIAFWLRGGRVVAAMNANIWDVQPQLDAIIRSGAMIDVARLANTEVPMTDFAESPPPA